MIKKKKKVRDILGVCGGNGVILHPAKDRLIANLEPRKIFHTKNQEQWRENFKNIPYFTDVNSVPFISKKRVKIIIGAPDCGHSSKLALSVFKKMFNPKQNESLQFYIFCVNKYQPEIFMMENLPAIMKNISIKDWKDYLPGYDLLFLDHSVFDFGNNQKTRKRLVIIGTKKFTRYFDKVFTDVYPVAKPRLVGRIEKYYKLNKENLTGCETEPLNKQVCMKFKNIKLNLGQVKKVWTTHFKDETRWLMPNTKMGTLPGVYRNTRDDYPKTAMKETRQFDSRGNVLSPRMIALIQGIPDDFKLHIDKDKLQYWLNKCRATVAKTPPYEIGLWFIKQLNKYEQWEKKRQS